jgi:hypothetical protein
VRRKRIDLYALHFTLLLGATGGAAGGGTAATGGTGGTLKFSTAGEGKGRHHPVNFFTLTLRTGNLFGSIKY